MKWIRTGRQLGQAVKNVQRFRHIVAVFARHGFSDIVQRMDLGRYLPTRFVPQDEDLQQNTPMRLRKAFEQLGPTFVKLGQVLSTRPDLIPEPFIEEFTKLQDDVNPLPYAVIKSVLERELGARTETEFRFIQAEPLASASIAQVHEAELKDGTKVVIKVQRPELQQIIDTDISLLAFMAKLLERYIPETRLISPVTIVDEFFRTLSNETDFQIEANNILKITENMKTFPEIVIPRVYRDLSTERVLTLQKIEGIPVNNLKELDRQGVDKKFLVRTGSRAFFKSIMIDGLFHGDLHGGNLFAMPNNQIGIIDFGIVGRLSQKSRDKLANMVMAILTEDYENLCITYAELGAADPSTDFDAFERDVRATIAPYLGLNISEVNSGRVLIEATKVAAKYNIKVPSDWMIVFKGILTMEGMGRSLDPHFDFIAEGHDLIKDLVKNQFSTQRLSKEAMWIAKDVGALLQVLPRQIRWMFKKFNRNDFALEIKSPQLDEIREQMEANGKRTSLSIVVAGLFIASSVALQFATPFQLIGMPVISAAYLIIGGLLMIRVLFK
ncbi:MAG: ABC1 kinase family protein [Bacteriovoracia bacterium]